MIIKTADKTIVNLSNYDFLEMVHNPSYNRDVYVVLAIISNADGDVAVEKPVCQFRSEDEAITYLENIEKRTSYVTIVRNAMSTTRNNRTLLNLSRFDALDLVVNDVPPDRIAGKMMTTETVPSGFIQATVRAIRYDVFGAVQKTIAYTEKFNSKTEAVAWFEQLTQRRTP